MSACKDCTNPTAKGWHVEEEITLTYGGLKKAQNEAIIQGVTYAMDYLEDINLHSGANAVSDFLEILTGQTILREGYWQEDFHKSHALHLENCQNFSEGTSAARTCEEKKLEISACIICDLEIDDDNPFTRFCDTCETAQQFGITQGILSAIQTLEAEDFTEHANILRDTYNMKESN